MNRRQFRDQSEFVQGTINQQIDINGNHYLAPMNALLWNTPPVNVLVTPTTEVFRGGVTSTLYMDTFTHTFTYSTAQVYITHWR